VIAHHSELAAPAVHLLPVDIRIAGCPPAPGAIAQALLDGLDELRE
jgi:Ni,Fe-hydrogenase III small subunit